MRCALVRQFAVSEACQCGKLPIINIINRHQSEDIKAPRSVNVDEEIKESCYIIERTGQSAPQPQKGASC